MQDDFVNRDSRYWDKDDRKRNKYSDYYDDDDMEMDDDQINGHISKDESLKSDAKMKAKRDSSFTNVKRESDPHHQQETPLKLSSVGSGGLYNERGRKELREHEQKLEDAFERELYSSKIEHTSGLNTREAAINHDHSRVNQTIDEDITFKANLGQKYSKDVSKSDTSLSDENVLYDIYEEEYPRTSFQETHNPRHNIELLNKNVMGDSMETSKTLSGIHEENTRSLKREAVVRQRSVQKTRHHPRKLL